MAGKKNDDLDKNKDLNDQDEFNDIDDGFGLPEVEYKPLEELEEEESGQVTDDEGAIYGSDTDDTAANTEEDMPGSYTTPPREEEGFNVAKVIAVIIILALAGLAAWYFGFYQPQEAAKEHQAKVEMEKQEEAERIAAEQRAREERLAREEAEKEAERLDRKETAKLKQGSVNLISSRTGRYYLIATSNVDGDLAADYANKLAAKGVQVTIIKPSGKSKFHRVAIEDADNLAAAEVRADELMSEYGGVWVFKY